MKSMKNVLFFVMLIGLVGQLNAANPVVNPSFEEDEGGIFSVRFFGVPTGWGEDLPDNFDAKVDTDWSTDGIYSLTIFARARTYYAFEQAIIYQDVDVTDYNNMVFDLRCLANKTNDINDWDGSKVTAFIAIDGNTVWESPNDVDVLYDRTIDISGINGVVTLSFGIRVNQLFESFQYAYWSMWDNIRLTNDLSSWPCGGNGYFDTDINFDCNVDIEDVLILSDYWLLSLADANAFSSPYKYLYDISSSHQYITDITGQENIDFIDLAMLADDYGKCSNASDPNCSAPAYGNYPLKSDMNNDSVVNFIDFAYAAESNDLSTMKKFSQQWLMICPQKK